MWESLLDMRDDVVQEEKKVLGMSSVALYVLTGTASSSLMESMLVRCNSLRLNLHSGCISTCSAMGPLEHRYLSYTGIHPT